jgi:hypothetical protein
MFLEILCAFAGCTVKEVQKIATAKISVKEIGVALLVVVGLVIWLLLEIVTIRKQKPYC